QDRLADAAAQGNRPQQSWLAVALTQGVQLAVLAAEEHLRPSVAVQVGGDHPADRPAQVEMPALVIAVAAGRRRVARACWAPSRRAGREAAEHAVRLGVQDFTATIAIDIDKL